MIFDRSARSIVVVCTCGAREVFPEQRAADSWAVDHLGRCTLAAADLARAVTASRQRYKRHAAPPR